MGTGPGIGKSLDRAFLNEIGNENDVRLSNGVNLKDANASNFKLAEQLRRGAGAKKSALTPQQHLVVGHQHNLVLKDR